MRKTHYFTAVLQRDRRLINTILGLIEIIVAIPRHLMIVCIRKNLGERYFSRFAAILLTLLLLITPRIFNLTGHHEDNVVWYKFPIAYPTWYMFVGVFVYMCIKRESEIKRSRSNFDFDKYSMYAGDINPFYFNLSKKYSWINIRVVEKYIEPASIFLVGWVCLFLGWRVGYLFYISAISSCISFSILYYKGDHFMLDQIDEYLINKDVGDAFLNDDNAWSPENGVRYFGPNTEDHEVKNKLLDMLYIEEAGIAI